MEAASAPPPLPEKAAPQPPSPEAVRHSEQHWLWQVTALSLVLGVMLALALRTTAHIRSIGLPDRGFLDLKDIRKQNGDLEKQRDSLRKEVSGYENSVSSERDSGQALKAQVAEYRALTGYAPARGSGVEVLLRDSPVKPPPGTEGMRDAFLLDIGRDVSGVVNELWAAGAEAMAIAGKDRHFERFVLTTTITPEGHNARVNGRSMAPPFTIRALGNPKELAGALSMNEGILQKVGLKELKMSLIKEKEQLELPAFAQRGVAGAPPASRQAAANH
jgi:uncharacterized protein YlxW (UPF0749 family)